MRDVLAILFLLLAAFLLFRYIWWAMSDARRRGKSALLVVILVLCSFPLGLIVWLLFRPPLNQSTLSLTGFSRPGLRGRS
jgi:hypothetical protein